MSAPHITVLVVGATGSIGRLVVEEAIRQGHAVRALVRSLGKAGELPSEVQVVIGDLTRPGTLSGVTDGIDAIVFTHGSDGAGKAGAEAVDYGGVRNVLSARGSRKARIALMTSIGVTNRTGAYGGAPRASWRDKSRSSCSRPGLRSHLAYVLSSLICEASQRHSGEKQRRKRQCQHRGPSEGRQEPTGEERADRHRAEDHEVIE